MATTKGPLEFLEHTADAHVRIRGSSLNQLFEHAAHALLSIMVDPTSVQARQSLPISLQANDLEELLVSWLNELLYLFETRDLLFSDFNVEVTGNSLQASIGGEPRDAARHPIQTAIKSTTYHRLHIERDADGYTAEVVFDL